MEQKTLVHAEEGKQEIVITRIFELPLELLFKAYTEPDLIAQWMGTKVLKLENKQHGSYIFETTDPKGNVHLFNGTIHEFVAGQKITRTFEMNNTPYGVQLEFFEFEKLTELSSKLHMHIVYKSIEVRNQILKLPFAQGINWAHNRLQNIFNQQ